MELRSIPNDHAKADIRSRRLSANLSFLFTEWSFLDRFAAAADSGFSAVEFMFPYSYSAEVLARKLENQNLRLALFNAPAGDWARGDRGVAAIRGCEEYFLQTLQLALSYARVLAVPHLHVMAGIADPQDPGAMATYRRNLSLAADLARRDGVKILVEPINGYDMPGYLLRDFDLAAQIVGDGSEIGLQFDVYHCQRLHGEVLSRLRTLLPVTGHVQIAGVPSRHEPRSPDLPLREIFLCLDDGGYAGRVGCEYHPAAGTLRGLDWIQSVQA